MIYESSRTAPREAAFRAHVYDGQGRILSMTEPDAELYGEASVVRTKYAPLSILTFDAEDGDSHSPFRNTPLRHASDGLGRLIRLDRTLKADQPVSRVSALWDSLGRPAGYLDPAGHRKYQQYDLMDRVTVVDDPNAGRTHFAYDAAGNLREVRDAAGITVRAEYDGLNRQVARFDPAHRSVTEVKTRDDFAPERANSAHAEGRAVRTVYPLGAGARLGTGSDAHAYDLHGRELSLTRTLQGHSFVLSWAYDHAGRLVQHTYPDGNVLQYNFDGASRPVSIDGAVAEVQYDDRGLISTLRYSNGTHVVQEHDVLQRLSTTRVRGAAGTVLQGFGYVRDRVGNVSAIKDLSDLRTNVRDDVSLDHDSWYRMTRAGYYGKASETIEVGFDELDNITHQTSSLGQRSPTYGGAYVYDTQRPNMLVRTDSSAFEFDAAGHLTKRDGTVLQRDHLGRLQRAVTAEGHEAEYGYGADAGRVLEWHDGGTTYHIGPDFEVRDGIGVIYARIGERRVARRLSVTLGPLLLADHNRNDQVDVGDAWLAKQRDRAPGSALPHLRGCARRLLLDAGEEQVGFHSDHLGSLTLATGEGGVVLGERAYYPFGAVRHSVGYVDSLGFTGQRSDPTTGLVHMGSRELDPITGRWSSPDPLFHVIDSHKLEALGQATTAYAYVAGRTMLWTDPDGLFGVGRGVVGALALSSLALKGPSRRVETALAGHELGGEAHGETFDADLQGTYIYRGVHARHPQLAAARRGVAVPGNITSTTSAERHNTGCVSRDSPFTSWTYELRHARAFAAKTGPGGVILRARNRFPPPGASWAWEESPDYHGEQEVLLRGRRESLEVLPWEAATADDGLKWKAQFDDGLNGMDEGMTF